MTLILTELSHFGIAMATDSSLTQTLLKPDGTAGDKDYYGARKLFVVPKLNAGISYWGWGDIPEHGASWEGRKYRTELWLPHFLETNKVNYNTISELAMLLEKELRQRIPKIDINENKLGDGGIHLAGYERVGDRLYPTFWHIHNGISQQLPDKKLDPEIVNANNDIPTELGRKILEQKGLARIANPPLGDYLALWELLFKPNSAFSQIVGQEGLTFPYADSLEKRGGLLAFQIETVVGIYRFSREGGGIATPTHTLTIDLQGRIELKI
jgi:hypothetical protein